MLDPYPFKKIADLFQQETDLYNHINKYTTGLHFSYALFDSQDIATDYYIFVLNLQHLPTKVHDYLVDIMPYYEDNKLLLESAMSTLITKLRSKLK